MIDLDRAMAKFMLLSVIGGGIGFVLIGTAIAPLMVIWLLGGALVITIVCWSIDIYKQERLDSNDRPD